MSIKTRTSGIMVDINVEPASGGTPFAGVGDIVAATRWYGLRAYSLAYAASGGPSIDLHNDSTGVFVGTVNVLTNGNLDTTTAATLIAGGASRIGKVYDQVGTAHMVQATLANMPTLVLNASGLAAGRPAMSFVSANNQYVDWVPSLAALQPFCLGGVAKYGAGATVNGIIIGDTSNFTEINFDFASGGTAVYAGTNLIDSGAAQNVYHTVQGLFNGASSINCTDGANTNGNAGTNQISAIHFGMGAVNGTNNPLEGTICEAGMWNSDISANFAAINSQQRTYWGF